MPSSRVVRELLDEVKRPKENATARFLREQRSLANRCTMSAASSAEVYAKLAEHVRAIIGLEREAIGILAGNGS